MTSCMSRGSLRRRRRLAPRSACRRSRAPRRPYAYLRGRSTARWCGCAEKACRISEAPAAGTNSSISTSSCRGRSARSSGASTRSCGTSRSRRRRSVTTPICSGESRTRWAGAVERMKGALPPSNPPTKGPPVRWLEIAVPAGVEAVEAVSEILGRVGYNGIAVDQPVEGLDTEPLAFVVKAYVVYDHVAKARVRRVREALGHLQAFELGPIGDLRLRRIADEDWLEAWKSSITPIRVGAFLVRPTWSDARADGAITIALDPGMAFGTGLHPTTQQCLATLGDLRLDGARVLDVGTGSGILAIAAAKRGAGNVVAVDIDPLAVRAAMENAKGNDVSVDIRAGSAADADGTFDVVLANLVGPALVRIAAELRARLRGSASLVAAGITREALPEVLAAFGACGLGVVGRDERGDWVRLILTV